MGPPEPSALGEHVRRLVRDDEHLAWHAKPDQRSFYVGNLIAGLFTLVLLSPFFLLPTGALVAGALVVIGQASPGLAMAVLAGLVVVGAPLVLWLAVRRKYDFAEFAVTDERVIHASGLIGQDASTVSLADVRDVDVTVGPLGKLFGTGKLAFQTAGGSDAGAAFAHVSQPYEALEEIEELRSRAAEAVQARA